jgi:large subunit ribosomal protein L17
MRHRRGIKKLAKPTDQRIALLRAIVASLIAKGKVKITLARAKEARRMVERLITLAKEGNLPSRRQALAALPDEKAIKALFSSAPDKFEGRPGGYTRITKVGFRRGDCAPMALLEII